MKHIITEPSLKNMNSPFTELFSLLEEKELSIRHVLNQHIDNAVEILLRGVQDVGVLLGIAIQDQQKIVMELGSIGFLISAISNLMEALYTLRSNFLHANEEEFCHE